MNRATIAWGEVKAALAVLQQAVSVVREDMEDPNGDLPVDMGVAAVTQIETASRICTRTLAVLSSGEIRRKEIASVIPIPGRIVSLRGV